MYVLQAEMHEAKRILSEFQQQQLIASKLRSLKAREEELDRREAQIREKERRLVDWETMLQRVSFTAFVISSHVSFIAYDKVILFSFLF